MKVLARFSTVGILILFFFSLLSITSIDTFARDQAELRVYSNQCRLDGFGDREGWVLLLPAGGMPLYAILMNGTSVDDDFTRYTSDQNIVFDVEDSYRWVFTVSEKQAVGRYYTPDGTNWSPVILPRKDSTWENYPKC